MATYKLTVSAEFESDLDLEELIELGSSNVELPAELTTATLRDFIEAVIEDDNSWAYDQIDLNETNVRVEVLDLNSMENYAAKKAELNDEEEDD